MEKYQNKYRIDTTRLKNWDYGANGFYFVTICARHHENYFGDIIQPVETLNFASLPSPQLHPTPIGKIAQQYWFEIPDHFPFVVLDEFVIMPDHLHGIFCISINRIVETQNLASLRPSSLPQINSAHNQKTWHRLYADTRRP